MILLIVLVRSVLTEAQTWGSVCWPFSNLKLDADKYVSAVALMQMWYLSEVNVVYFKVGKSFRGNIKGKWTQGEWAVTTKERSEVHLCPCRETLL